MTISDAYLSAIKKFEGFTEKASWDYAQYTNGYGTRAKSPDETITRAEAARRFRAEINEATVLAIRDGGARIAIELIDQPAVREWIQSLQPVQTDGESVVTLEENPSAGDV